MSTCLVLLIDESAAMQSPAAKMPGAPLTAVEAPRKSKADSVATAVNALLNRLAQETECEVALVGYRTSAAGEVEVGCRWGGALAGRDFVSTAELPAAPLAVERRVRRLPGPDGLVQEQPIDFPVWYQPQLGDKAPHIAAFHCCQQLLAHRSGRSGAGGVPLVVNVFAGPSADGNPLRATKDVMDMQTPDGAPLVLQIHVGSSDAVPPTLYPANRAYLKGGVLRDLFDRVSLLPDHLAAALKAAKVPTVPNARCLVYNARMEDVTRALSLIQAHLKLSAAAPLAATPSAPWRPAPPSIPPPQPTPATEAVGPEPAAPLAAEVTVGTTLPETSPVTIALETPAEAAVSEPPLGPITPDRPALVLFVLDRSVDDPFHGDLHNACVRLQGRLGDVVEQLAKFGGGSIDVGVVSYGLDAAGEVEVRTSLEGGLAPRSFARDSELETGAVRIDEFTEELPNGVGGLISIHHRRPILVEAEPTPAAAATPAFAQASQLVAAWCAANPATQTPPVLIHLTRGKADAAEAENAAAQLKSVTTAAGAPVVLYHVVETEPDGPAVLCPDSESQLADPNLQVLWRLTSPLLGRLELAADKPTINEHSRGLVVNGKPNLLLDALRRARG